MCETGTFQMWHSWLLIIWIRSCLLSFVLFPPRKKNPSHCLPPPPSCVAWWCRPARTPPPPSSTTACCAAWSASCCRRCCRASTAKRWWSSAWTESTCRRRTGPWPPWASCSRACTPVRRAPTPPQCGTTGMNWCLHHWYYSYCSSHSAAGPTHLHELSNYRSSSVNLTGALLFSHGLNLKLCKLNSFTGFVRSWKTWKSHGI